MNIWYECNGGAHFTTDLSIIIQIRWKIHFALIQSRVKWSLWYVAHGMCKHYNDVIMSAMTFQITSLTSVYSTLYSGADLRTHQSSASLAFVGGIHRWPVNSPHKGSVTRKYFHMMTSSRSFVARKPYNEVTLKPIFLRIWITMENRWWNAPLVLLTHISH